jgi:hypothetical protein
MVDGSPAAMQSSMFVKSSGDEPGALGGVVSQVFAMEATFLSFSPTVLFEGQPACRLTDKMLMNKGNTVCMSGELQCLVVDPVSVPPESLNASEPEAPVFCTVDALMLSCGHAERGVMVDLMVEDLPVLQVIGAMDEPDTIVVGWDGTCGFGNSRCASMMVMREPHGKWQPIDPGTNELELAAPGLMRYSKDGWLVLFEQLIGARTIPHDSYLLRPMTCNGEPDPVVHIGISTHIEVFPEAKFEGEVALAYAHPKMDEKATGFSYKRSATWKIGGTIAAEIGGLSLEYKADSETEEGDPLPLFGSLIDKVGKTTAIFDSMKRYGADVQGDILPPELKFTAALELAELPNSPLVGPKGSFEVTFDPLIGFELKVSILDYLIRFAGALAPGAGVVLARALVMIRQKAAQGFSRGGVEAKLDLDIELIVHGKIKGGFKLEFVDGRGELSGDTAMIEGSIGVQVEGRVVGKGKVWNIEIAAGAKMGVAAAKADDERALEEDEAAQEPCRFGSNLTPHVEKGRLKMGGEVFFTGMAFYYLVYLEVGGTGVDSEGKGSASAEESEEGAKPSVKSVLAKGKCVLIDPWTWSWGARAA